jgi:hypothetical protein
MSTLGVEAAWRVHERTISARGVARTVRFAQFATGWLVSADTEDGPTLGADRSPYLAAHRALEPLGIGLVEALTLVGPIARE